MEQRGTCRSYWRRSASPSLPPPAIGSVVRNTGISYRISEHAVLDCATFRAGANDSGGYTPLPTLLEILRRPVCCSERPYICYFGDCHLDVTASPASPKIQIAGRIGRDWQPDHSPSADSGTENTQQLARVGAERNQRR